MLIFAKESKKRVKIIVRRKKIFEKKVTRGSLKQKYYSWQTDNADSEFEILKVIRCLVNE